MKGTKLSILIVEDEKKIREALEKFCAEIGFTQVQTAPDRQSAIACWQANKGFDALLLDIKLGAERKEDDAGYHLLKQLRSREGRPRRVFIYSAMIEGIFLGLEAVADEVSIFNKPSDYRRLQDALTKYVAAHADSPTGMIAACDAMKDIEASFERLVASDLPILLLGGSGDGKTMLAKRIAKAYNSNPKRVELINCAAIPENLAESELFGHVKGAFTGAFESVPGKLMTASGFDKVNATYQEGNNLQHGEIDKESISNERTMGVVILDELGAMPLYLQAKLLSVLDGEPIKPIGSRGRGFRPNFRVIATTNEIDRLEDPNLFRIDLRKRLEGWVIHMPPLHKQQELIRHLAQTEMPRIKDKQGHMLALPVKTWHSAALNLLLEKAIGFEGGVRELKNVIARAVYFAHFNGEAEITLDTIAKALAQTLPSRSAEVEVNKKRKSGIKDADAVALVVAKVKNKLIEMGVTEASIVTHDGHRVDYKKIGKVIAKRGNEFVQWCISNLEVNPNDAEGEATFLSAVNYRGKSKNPRNTIYQNWRQTKVVE